MILKVYGFSTFLTTAEAQEDSRERATTTYIENIQELRHHFTSPEELDGRSHQSPPIDYKTPHVEDGRTMIADVWLRDGSHRQVLFNTGFAYLMNDDGQTIDHL